MMKGTRHTRQLSCSIMVQMEIVQLSVVLVCYFCVLCVFSSAAVMCLF